MAPLTRLTDLGVNARREVRTGWTARRTPLGTNSLDRNPMTSTFRRRVDNRCDATPASGEGGEIRGDAVHVLHRRGEHPDQADRGGTLVVAGQCQTGTAAGLLEKIVEKCR